MESDHVYPEDNGEHGWINDPTEIFQFDPKFDEFDDYFNKSLSITPQIPTTHNLLVNQHITHWRVMFDFFSMKRHLKSWNPEGIFPHDPGGRIICQFRQYLEKLFAISIGYISMMRNNLQSYKKGVTGFYPKLKLFWSCSHMNCCLQYILHINLHILYFYFTKMNLNLKELQESKEYIKSYQENKIEFLDEFYF